MSLEEKINNAKEAGYEVVESIASAGIAAGLAIGVGIFSTSCIDILTAPARLIAGYSAEGYVMMTQASTESLLDEPRHSFQGKLIEKGRNIAPNTYNTTHWGEFELDNGDTVRLYDRAIILEGKPYANTIILGKECETHPADEWRQNIPIVPPDPISRMLCSHLTEDSLEVGKTYDVDAKGSKTLGYSILQASESRN